MLMRVSPFIRAILIAILFGLCVGTAGAQTVSFELSQETVAPGDEAVVEMSVSGFEDLTTAQFTVNWDPSVASFSAVENLDLRGLAQSNFGTPEDGNINDGTVTFSWDDPDAEGVTRTDGTVIFELRLQAASASGESTAMSFGNDPTPQSVSVNAQPATFDGTAGSINIGEGNAPPQVEVNTGLTLTQGGSEPVTTSELSASDEDDVPSALTFEVTSSPDRGELRVGGAPAGSFTQQDLESGRVEYNYTASSSEDDGFTFDLRDDDGAGPDSQTFSVTVQPPSPTSLRATPGDGQIILEWGPGGSSNPDEYRVYRSTSPFDTVSEATEVGGEPVGGTSFTDTGLSNGEEYFYRVLAVDGEGDESGLSDPASATPGDRTAPPAPNGLSASAGEGEIQLSWNSVDAGDLDGYNVYRSQSPFSDVSGASRANDRLVSGSSFTDDEVSNGTEYFYRVTAVDDAGNESDPSGQENATPEDRTAPPPPTDLSGSASEGEVQLNWDEVGASDLDGYNVYRSQSSFGNVSRARRVNDQLVDGTFFTDTGVVSGETYYYRVTAVDEAGNESDPSGQRKVTTLLTELQIGPLTLTANQIQKTGGDTYEASGNVSIEGILELEGPVTVDRGALTLEGRGALTVVPGPVGTIYEGNFQLSLQNASSTLLDGTGLSAANSVLEVGGLNTQLGGIGILTGADPGVRIEGQLILPNVLGAIRADVKQLQITEKKGLALAGEIEVGSVKFKNGIATLEELRLSLNTVRTPARFEGSAKLGLPIFGVGLGASARIIEGSLDKIALEVDLSRPVAIPGTGMGLAGIGGGVSGLQVGPTKLFIEADIVPSAAGVTTRVVTLESLGLTYTFDTKITGSGNLAIFERGIAQANLTVVPSRKIAFEGKVGFSVPAAQQDILSGSLDASIENRPPVLLKGGLSAYLTIPDFDSDRGFPWGLLNTAESWISWFDLPYENIAYTENTLDGKPLEGTGKVRGEAGILKGARACVVVCFEGPIKFAYGAGYDSGTLNFDWATNMSNLNLKLFPTAALKINKAAQRENRFEGKSLIVGRGRSNTLLKRRADTLRQEFTLQEETPFLIIRVEADRPFDDYTITVPDGRTISPEGSGSDTHVLYMENQNEDQSFYTVKNSQVGEWSINLPADGTEYAIDVIGASPAPALDLDPPNQTGSSVGLSWEANDPDDEATVDLYYDDDQSGQDGVLIAEDLPEDQTAYTWNTEDVPTGTYYVYAAADDGKNAPVVDYTSGPVQVLASGAPAAPTGVSASPADTALSVSWNQSRGAERYTVYYAEGRAPTHQSSAAGVGDTTEVALGDIPAGRTYRVAVTGTDTTGRESRLSEVATASYESQSKNNTPLIATTDPAEIAQEGESYRQQIEAEDADGDAVTYELARGPETMTIRNGGEITWTPVPGRYDVKVRAVDPKGAADSLSWQLRALGREESTARIEFSRSEYVGEQATGQLVLANPELNQSTAEIESTQVRVRTAVSLSDNTLTLRETQANSGQFRAGFGLGASTGGRPGLAVAPVDTLQVTYEDQFPDTTVTAEATFFEKQPLRFAPDIARPRPEVRTTTTFPDLAWSSVEGADQYRVQVATDSTFQGVFQERTIADTSLSVEDLKKGATYYWRVRAENVVEGPWSELARFTTRPAELTARVERFFGNAAGPADYRLVALPGTVEQGLSGAVPGEAGLDWQAWWDNGASQDYFQKFDGTGTFSFRPGRGFWLTSTEPWSLEEQIATVDLSSNGTYGIELHEGWNIISNPLGIDVRWTAVEAVNNGELQPLWQFSGGAFQETDTLGTAADGTAYYFLNDENLSSLTIPWPDATLPKSGPISLADTSRTLVLTARRESQSSRAQIRFRNGRGEEEEIHEVPAPPVRFSSLSLRIDEGSDSPPRRRYLAATYRQTRSGGQTVELRLTASNGEPVAITLRGLDEIQNRRAALLHPAQGKSYKLREEKAVRFVPEQDTIQLKLALGNETFLDRQEEEVQPEKIGLTAYPNPMRQQATLAYTLPETEEVRIAVYDVLGREVTVLANGHREPGRHRIRFGASGLPSGVYFARLTVGGQTISRRITVVQ